MKMRIVPSSPFVSLRPMRHSPDLPSFEFDPIQPTTVVLPPETIQWAVQICQQGVAARQQWATFLRALALKGVQQWLEEGASALTLTCDLTQPPGPGMQAEVNGFRLWVVPQGSLSDSQVSIPQSSVDSAQHFAHLYILAEVKEEANQVTILCGLRRDRLLAHRQRLTPRSDGTYVLPVAYFDSPPEDILLYLNCLNPAHLAQAIPQDPPLQAGAGQVSSTTAINVGRWLQDQIGSLADTVTSTFAWSLLPPLSVSHAMMAGYSPAEALETVLRELEPTGVMIPPTARGAYTDLQTGVGSLRLYALTWPCLDGPQPEWCLFLVLGATVGEQLLPGTHLVVRDAATVLANSILSSGHNANHLYAQVFGTWDEAFTVTVTLPNGSTLSWPPFIFRPGEE